jgi:hypothetical protein
MPPDSARAKTCSKTESGYEEGYVWGASFCFSAKIRRSSLLRFRQIEQEAPNRNHIDDSAADVDLLVLVSGHDGS